MCRRSRLAPSQGKAWEPLGGDCFKALGGGAAAKKGQEKEKAKMFTEKKASGKYDGEIKPIQGMALRSRLGRARRPTQRERKHQAVGSPTNASQPHEHPLLEGQPVCRLQDQVSQFRWSSVPLLRLKAAGLSELRCTPQPRPFSSSPRGSGWVWAPNSSFV